MDSLRTPESAFSDIKDFPYTPKYVDVTDTMSRSLRMAYIDEGDVNGTTILLLHGEPTWSYLYRKMIPPLVSAGFRVLAPDLIGFGRSDKPVAQEDYTYARHLIWLGDWFKQVAPESVALFCQDWGGILGLRLVADMPQRFSHVMAANTGLPTGEHPPSDAFLNWRRFSQEVEIFPPAGIVKGATTSDLDAETLAAYNAPFPEEKYKAGARVFPLLVPATPSDPQTENNRAAWSKLRQFEKPFMTAFSDSDPVTAGGDKLMQSLIPGCEGQEHVVIENAGHFLQEDKGEELAQHLITFINKN